MGKIKTDELEERVGSAGITVNSTVKVDTIAEKTSANGVSIDGVKLKDSVVEVDTISESTSAAGVTIDSVLLKDGAVQNATITGGTLTDYVETDGGVGATTTAQHCWDLRKSKAKRVIYEYGTYNASDNTRLSLSTPSMSGNLYIISIK